MNILLFGITRDIIGKASLQLSDATSKTVGELKTFLKVTYPELGKLSSLAVAVNSNYAEDDMEIAPSDEIALIPPVSGG